MFIEFRVANFRSFHEEQTLSLVASKDNKHRDNLIKTGNFNLLKSAAIYGANASGKSNLVKAISFMDSFVEGSATKMNVGDPIDGIIPFRLGADSAGKPSSFEISFMLEDECMRYGFSATRDRVHDEWLESRPAKGKPHVWFERRLDPVTGQYKWTFGKPLAAEEKILTERTRENGLVLSRGAELNVKPLADVFMWFRKKLWPVDLSRNPEVLMMETSQRVKQSETLRQRVTELVRHADLGIADIRLDEERLPLDGLPDETKDALIEFLKSAFRARTGPNGEKELMMEDLRTVAVHTLHRIPEQEGFVQFNMEEDESNGTRRLFALAAPILEALEKGALVVVDEIECSMHPLLTRKLLELFQSPHENKNGAQLVFATHDSTLMDPELFRRDQIYLVEKNQHGASELYSLYDFDTKDRPRNTEAFQRNYLAGRYGGVPKFGPIFEDLRFQ